MSRISMWMSFWCGVLALSVAAADIEKFPKPRCAQYFDFETARKPRVAPAGQADAVTIESGADGSVLHITAPKGKIAVYNGLKLSSPGPGTLSVRFRCRFLRSDNVKATLRVNCNLPGGKNGSAGHLNSDIAPKSEWTLFHKVFTIPPESTSIQYILGFSGAVDAELDDLEVVYTPDTISVPLSVKPIDFSAPASQTVWNPCDVQYGFYSFGKDAAVPALMQFAADADGLAVLFRNFIAPDMIQKSLTARDAALRRNDANELYFFDEAREVGWHFIVSAGGARFDARMYQKMAGDPWRSDASWNGEWQGAAKITRDGFETRFFIPWKTLGIQPSQGALLAFNAACDYPSANEKPHWCAYRGTRMDLGKYGKLRLADGKLTVSRARSSESLSYAVPRPAPQFAALLEKGVPGGYTVEAKGTGLLRNDFPKDMMAKVDDAQFERWKDELFRAWAAAGVDGPPWPWTLKRSGGKRLERYSREGMKFPLSASNSDVGRAARRNGAKLINPTSDSVCDMTDPAYLAASEHFIRAFRTSGNYELIRATARYAFAQDEPTNPVEICFNPVLNPEGKKTIEQISDRVRSEYGSGKYGVPFLPGIAPEDVPFARIAFYRWWNRELKKNLAGVQNAVHETFPGLPVMLTCDSNTAGQSYLDIANLNGLAEMLGTDPYPTSTSALYGMGRALYHVGFSCRVVNDLAPSAQLMAVLQCFNYHGSHGDLPAMREWVSQALKNGADHFRWYCSKAPAEIFDDYAAMLELSALVSRMDKVRLPQETVTLVWYSNFDKWAKADRALHATYAVYVMLAEVLGSNFRFAADTSLANGDVKLENYKLLYVPVMNYTTPEIAGKIAAWVRQGGTLVTFDPLFMRWNLDGNANATRTELTGLSGTTPPVKTASNSDLLWNGRKLPVAMIANASALPGSRFASYSMNPDGGRVLMTYPDNTPAAWERRVGKGKVIYFAVQPFAGSDIITQFGAWRDFFAGQAADAGEATNLPIRDFLLPDPPRRVNLKPVFRPR